MPLVSEVRYRRPESEALLALAEPETQAIPLSEYMSWMSGAEHTFNVSEMWDNYQNDPPDPKAGCIIGRFEMPYNGYPVDSAEVELVILFSGLITAAANRLVGREPKAIIIERVRQLAVEEPDEVGSL